MNFFQKAAITTLFTLIASFLIAQVELEVITNPINVKVEHIGFEEGVLSTNLMDLQIDSYGFLWIATIYGLTSYDGYNYKTFLSDNMDSTSLPDDRIHSICEDHTGSLWISTQRGLSRYNRESENFTTFYPDSENLNSPDNIIYYIREDSEGLLWTFTSSGLFSFNGNVFQSYKQDSMLLVKPYLKYFTRFPDLRRYISLWSEINFKEDKKGNIWISGTKGGLKRFDREENKFQHYLYDPADKNGLRSELTVSVNIDKHDSVWVSTWGGGLHKLLDEEEGTFRQYANDPGDPNSIFSDRLEQVFVNENGDLWVLGESGFSRYNYESDDFTTYKIPFNPEPYTYENILLKMCKDESGIMWIISENGLYRYEPESTSITFICGQDSAGIDIVDVVSDTYGIAWFITYIGGGVSKIDPQDKSFGHFYMDSKDPSNSSNDVNEICVDNRGGLWWGAFGSGLFYSNPAYNDNKIVIIYQGIL